MPRCHFLPHQAHLFLPRFLAPRSDDVSPAFSGAPPAGLRLLAAPPLPTSSDDAAELITTPKSRFFSNLLPQKHSPSSSASPDVLHHSPTQVIKNIHEDQTPPYPTPRGGAQRRRRRAAQMEGGLRLLIRQLLHPRRQRRRRSVLDGEEIEGRDAVELMEASMARCKLWSGKSSLRTTEGWAGEMLMSGSMMVT